MVGFEIDHFEIGVENREIPESISNSEERCCGSDFKSAIVTADVPYSRFGVKSDV